MESGRESATPQGKAVAAHAWFNLGVELTGWGRPREEIEEAWRGAVKLGRESDTPEGAEVVIAVVDFRNFLQDPGP